MEGVRNWDSYFFIVSNNLSLWKDTRYLKIFNQSVVKRMDLHGHLLFSLVFLFGFPFPFLLARMSTQVLHKCESPLQAKNKSSSQSNTRDKGPTVTWAQIKNRWNAWLARLGQCHHLDMSGVRGPTLSPLISPLCPPQHLSWPKTPVKKTCAHQHRGSRSTTRGWPLLSEQQCAYVRTRACNGQQSWVCGQAAFV